MEMDSKHDKEETVTDTEHKQRTSTTEQDKPGQSPFMLMSSILCLNFRDVAPFKAFFFAGYGGFGSLLPYLSLYFKQLGLSATQTGILIGVRPLTTAIGAPVWGILSDKYKKRRVAVIVAVLCMMLRTLLIMPVQPHNEICLKHYENKTNSSSTARDRHIKPGNATENGLSQKSPRAAPAKVGIKMEDGHVAKQSRISYLVHAPPTMSYNADFPDQQNELWQLRKSKEAKNETLTYERWIDSKEISRIFVILLFIVMIGELFGSAAFAVVDACVVDYLGDERTSYGRIRLWGSIGIAIATMVTGAVINSTRLQNVCGQERRNYFIAFYFFFGFSALSLVSSMFMKIVYREPPEMFISKGVKFLFNSVQKSSFWFVTFCLGVFDGFQMDFTSWFLDDLGASSLLVGVAATLHFCVNVASFFVSKQLLKSIGYANTITLGLLLYAALFVCLSLTNIAWLAAVWYALLGMAFALSWSASVTYSGLISTSLGIGAVAQGLLNGIYVGGGTGGGTILGGVLIDVVGVRATFQIYAGLAIVALVLYNALQQIEEKKNDEQNQQNGAAYEALPTEDD